MQDAWDLKMTDLEVREGQIGEVVVQALHGCDGSRCRLARARLALGAWGQSLSKWRQEHLAMDQRSEK